MAAPTQTYIDPSIAADSGTGTIGDPYGDVQYALDQVTRDSTNGDQMNVKAGTDEILSSALTLATYGSPTLTAPLIFRGYTAVADDGGIGGISGNGSLAMFVSAYNYVQMIDMHCHNSGSANILTLGTQSVFRNVEVDNSTGRGLQGGTKSDIQYCYIHNVGERGIRPGEQSYVAHNFLKNGTNDFTIAIIGQDGAVMRDNIISIDGSSIGIQFGGSGGWIINNTIWSNGGTGEGIDINSGTGAVILNNYVEGFSGVGGFGILLQSGTNIFRYGHNKWYNNATNESNSADVWDDLGNNSALGASPLADPASDDFTVDIALRALGWPADFPGASTNQFLDVGAAQRQERDHVIAGMRFRYF